MTSTALEYFEHSYKMVPIGDSRITMTATGMVAKNVSFRQNGKLVPATLLRNPKWYPDCLQHGCKPVVCGC